MKFRGQDYGKSKTNKSEQIERVMFNNVTTLKQVFTPIETQN